MVRKRILLLTYHYPYNKDESFLESEIPVLIKNNADIIVHPVIYLWRNLPGRLRTMPASIRLITPRYSKLNFIFTVCRLFSPILSIFRLTELRQNYNQSYFRFVKESIISAIKAALIYDSIRRIVDERKVDIIYCYWKTEIALAGAYLKFKGWNGRVISRCHGYDLYEERRPLGYDPFQHFNREYLDHVYPVSKDGVDYLKNKGYSSNKLTLGRLGVRAATALSKGTSGGRRIHVVSCSRISPEKRLRLISEVLVRVSERLSLTWTHLGHHPLGLDMEKRAIEELEVILRNAKGRLTWSFEGWLPNSKVLAFYNHNNVDIFINLSATEGVPVSIMEALAHGIPVFATDVGGTGELLTEDSGRLVDPGLSVEDMSLELINFISWYRANQSESKSAAHHQWEKLASAETVYRTFINNLLTL